MLRNILFAYISLILIACASGKMEIRQGLFAGFDTEAHRGGRGLMPENTIPAMLHAIDLNVVTLEMDIHVSADKKLIVAHDDYINPTFTLDADGKEISPSDAKKYPLYQMSYKEIRKYDVGSKLHPGFTRQKKMKVEMPLLSDLIDSVQIYLKKTGKKQVYYNIETKCDASGDNILNPQPDEFVSLLMDVILKKKISSYVVIQSFDKRTLQVLNKKYPQIKTAFLVSDDKQTLDTHLADLGFIPFIYSPQYTAVDAALIKDCQSKGMKIVPWTVNSKAEIVRLKSLGVDGIISDYPDLFDF
jgi:glycerophosphoryl diester phosphodiesterase